MFFFSNLWRYTKLTITGAGAALALAMLIGGIIIGTGTKGIIIIVGGSIFLVQSGLLFFDNSKVQAKLKQHVNKLEYDINEFEIQNREQRTNLLKFIDENKTLAQSLNESEKQISCLGKLKEHYEEANNKYTQLLEEQKNTLIKQEEEVQIYQTENQELKLSLQNMENIKNEFINEITNYKNLMERNETQLKQLESAKDIYIEENEKLQETNQHNVEELEKLKTQVSKLKQLYSNSLELLDNLRQAGDLFTNFGESIGEQVSHLDTTQSNFDQTLHTFQNLIEKLKQSTFSKLDKNNDGKITADEFSENIEKL